MKKLHERIHVHVHVCAIIPYGMSKDCDRAILWPGKFTSDLQGVFLGADMSISSLITHRCSL